MNKLLERLRNEFQGNADLLIAKAQELAKALLLDQEGSEGNERLLRHYVSMGVVDKPSREGRDALYGFRHLVQFVAARRLLAEGYSLAKIANYTAVVHTEALSAFLEKPGRASEAELLVAAFRTEVPARAAPTSPGRRHSPPKPLPQVSSSMGMVDVMHEMREMEQRVHVQLKDMQRKVRDMLESALQEASARVQVQRIDPVELKAAVRQLAQMMEEATQRFDSLMHKPIQMIEKQMDQQRYLFDQAHKQKDFLEHMFGQLMQEQRHDLQVLFERHLLTINELTSSQTKFFEEMKDRLNKFESDTTNRLYVIEKHMEAHTGLPPSTPEPKEGTA